MDGETATLLSRADQAIGRLDGVTQIVPNPDLFIAMYVRREAVDSSQIEGMQSSLQDVLAFELDPATRDLPRDVEEVANYDHGLPVLVHCALAHVQFETIHPFLDGNGRVGRLLIAFLLVHREVLH